MTEYNVRRLACCVWFHRPAGVGGVEELDTCAFCGTGHTHPLPRLAGLPSRGHADPAQKGLAQLFLDPINAAMGFPPPRLESFPPCLSAFLI